MVLVEAIEPEILGALGAGELDLAALVERGATSAEVANYRLHFVLTDEDVRAGCA